MCRRTGSRAGNMVGRVWQSGHNTRGADEGATGGRRGCRRGAGDARSCQGDGRCGGRCIHGRDARSKRSSEGAGRAQRGRGQRGATTGQGNADREGGARRTAESTRQRVRTDGAVAGWMRDATGVSMRKGCRWFYGAGIVEQTWHGGEDTAARWTGSGIGVPTGVRGAAQVDARQDGGASAQGVGALTLTTRGGAGSAPRWCWDCTEIVGHARGDGTKVAWMMGNSCSHLAASGCCQSRWEPRWWMQQHWGLGGGRGVNGSGRRARVLRTWMRTDKGDGARKPCGREGGRGGSVATGQEARAGHREGAAWGETGRGAHGERAQQRRRDRTRRARRVEAAAKRDGTGVAARTRAGRRAGRNGHRSWARMRKGWRRGSGVETGRSTAALVA
ncbi:hypothetical protein DFH08DRAFT_1033466 [Mycena albidolilacea]|uniref:Uncharacterized protein n=1 Tax=Mycena albidolilacea TaxID=1033008 RepID=A0AAD6ZGM8_9AGAR|nr:hypothetical protein DFH08DRAFT_1033466 [Mycena albidolilacea]